MELLIGAIISLGASILKKATEKIGMEMTKNLVLISVFFVSGVVAFFVNNGTISQEALKTAGIIFGSAIGYYEVVTKRFINPIIDKIK